MSRVAVLVAVLLGVSALGEPWMVAPKPRGFVRFTVEGPLDDVTGDTRAMAGEFVVDPSAWAGGKGTFAVDLGSLRTGIDQRDDDMRAEFLETKRYPFAILTLDGLSQATPPALTIGGKGTAIASATLEVHGVRRALSFPLTVKLESQTRLVVTGAFQVPFADFAISRPQRLFLKLGDTADVSFEVAFVPKPAPQAQPVASAPVPQPVPQPTVTQVLPAAPPAKRKAARKPKPGLQVTFRFSGDEPKARGEKLFHSPAVGGPGNALTCFHCHAKSDERSGLRLDDGYVRAATTLYNAGQRPTFWGGFATNAGAAASICQKQFMKGSGLSETQERELQAFIDAISPDAAPSLDYAANVYRSMETLLRDPTSGDPVKGKALADRYCMTCHLEGRVGPVWTLGLYEPDWVVRRVRRLEGHQNKQMPPWTIARLPDSELRDIVTYLTASPGAAPVFNRKKSSPVTGAR